MALTQSTETVHGIQLEGMYFRIVAIHWTSDGGAEGMGADVVVSAFASKEARDNGKSPIYDKIFRYDGVLKDEVDIRQAMYTFLKTLPEFESAEDI